MFSRQKTGSVVCTSCGSLVGVNDDRCYNCGRRNPGLWGFGPMLRRFGNDLGFVTLVVYGCSILYVAMLLVSVGLGGDIMGGGNPLGMLSPVPEVALAFGSSGAIPVFRFDMWWTVLSAGWLHAGLLHIGFNMWAARQLAPATADLYGPGRMVIIYVAGGVAGFTLSSVAGEFFPTLIILRGGQFTVGASASISGLIGAILAYGHRSGSGMARSYAMSNVGMLLLMGFLIPGIDNYAHMGGFGGGYFVARFLDPMKPERIDHIAIAVGLLAISILSMVASVIHGMYF